MSVTIGIWTVSRGKGNRHYINCKDSGGNFGGVMHPEQLAERNGCGMYGFEVMQDLALAILKFEEEQYAANSTIGKLKAV